MIVTIRPVAPLDAPAVRRVHERAFGRQWEADLVDALTDTGQAVISLLAAMDGQVVGHVLFSEVALAPSASGFRAVGLAPLAVLPDCQRQGVGACLVVKGLAACRAAGYGLVAVLGHSRYYPRFGFERASSRGLGNEYGADEEFMVLELRPGALSGHTGVVRFASEFRTTVSGRA